MHQETRQSPTLPRRMGAGMLEAGKALPYLGDGTFAFPSTFSTFLEHCRLARSTG